MMQLFFVWADLKELDVAAMCTDEGPCQAFIRSSVRKHIPDAMDDDVERYTELMWDVWCALPPPPPRH